MNILEIDRDVAVLLAFAGRGQRADDRRGELAFARQHGQRGIGEQRVAGADAVDQPSTKLSTTKNESSA